MDYILPHRVKVGFDISLLDPVDLLDRVGLGDADSIGANPYEVAMSLVQIQVLIVGASSPDGQETPEVSEFGCDRSWDVFVLCVGPGHVIY